MMPRLGHFVETEAGRRHMTARALTVGSASYPVVLPNIRDPRLHVAGVIITIHVLGQVALGFVVSVPQILAAIITCAVIEIAITFHQTRSIVWPASAMLTGSGVALILRVVGTPVGDHWTLYAWWVFAAVAGLSLLSKYVIRYRGTHVFNPSNIGLVVTFIVLGSSRVEPLDFWWGPLDVPMLLAYAAILGGGLLITRRLKLLALAGSFWVVLAVGLGVLAASGHCMTANWAFSPVCGADYWRIVIASPETMVFLFFMITDPKTVPGGQVGRVVFGALVGVASVIGMAMQSDEFGTKVALLAGLVVICLARPILDRVVPAAKSGSDSMSAYVRRMVLGRPESSRPARRGARVVAAALVLLAFPVAVVLAGTPSRGFVAPDTAELLSRTPVHIDESTLPSITVAPEVIDFDHTLEGAGIQQVLVTLAQNLEVENQALVRRDGALLAAVDHGDRLTQMQAALDRAREVGTATVHHYDFENVDVSLIVPFGVQTGLSLGFHVTGTVTEDLVDYNGNVMSSTTRPVDTLFAVRRATGARWLNVGELSPPS
jgi:Na+-translocating ferredoxin:NAD+ oxidoreductase RnfD subunit